MSVDNAVQTPDVAGQAPEVAGQAPEGRRSHRASPVRRELAKAPRIGDLRSRSIVPHRLEALCGNRFDCVDTTLSLVSTQRVMYLSDGKIEATWLQLKFSPGYILL